AVLNDGRFLQFADVRKFGTLEFVNKLESYQPIARLGVDGLELSGSNLDLIRSKSKTLRKPIKNFLLDQNIIAGAGNIYASESLFKSKTHPTKPTNSVDIERICYDLTSTLAEA